MTTPKSNSSFKYIEVVMKKEGKDNKEVVLLKYLQGPWTMYIPLGMLRTIDELELQGFQRIYRKTEGGK